MGKSNNHRSIRRFSILVFFVLGVVHVSAQTTSDNMGATYLTSSGDLTPPLLSYDGGSDTLTINMLAPRMVNLPQSLIVLNDIEGEINVTAEIDGAGTMQSGSFNWVGTIDSLGLTSPQPLMSGRLTTFIEDSATSLVQFLASIEYQHPVLALETGHFERLLFESISGAPCFSMGSAAVYGCDYENHEAPIGGLAYWVPTDPAIVYACAKPDLAIPLNGNAPAVSTIFVDETAAIVDLDVILRLSHTYVGDLDVVLTHLPSQQSVVLLDEPGDPAIGPAGCSRDDIDAEFDDDASRVAEDTCDISPAQSGPLQPNGLLGDLNGVSAQGGWQLVVTDTDISLDDGLLKEWCLALKLEERLLFPADIGAIYNMSDTLTATPISYLASSDTLSASVTSHRVFHVGTSPPDIIISQTSGIISFVMEVSASGEFVDGQFFWTGAIDELAVPRNQVLLQGPVTRFEIPQLFPPFGLRVAQIVASVDSMHPALEAVLGPVGVVLFQQGAFDPPCIESPDPQVAATYFTCDYSTLPSLGYEMYLSGPDLDRDGYADSVDNCIEHANADQRDTNGDGFGNVCDPDIDNNGIVNVLDLGRFRTAFFQSGDRDEDFNGDGIVNATDLGILKAFFFGEPGPSGVAN